MYEDFICYCVTNELQKTRLASNGSGGDSVDNVRSMSPAENRGSHSSLDNIVEENDSRQNDVNSDFQSTDNVTDKVATFILNSLLNTIALLKSIYFFFLKKQFYMYCLALAAARGLQAQKS